MAQPEIGQHSVEDRREIQVGIDFLEQAHLKPEIFWPFLKPCQVKILIVVDGLDFSDDDFGLATYVRSLLDIPGRYVRFSITLGHLGAPSDTQMMAGESRITRRITNLKFDVADHFTPDMYDEVMLFGIATSMPRRGAGYPSDRLSDKELAALTEFMNAGGGLFATGDHGNLGRFLCHAVPRARNMRLWQSTAAQNELDEVSMNGPRRNDTNRVGGSPGSQFDDQSDDVPQSINPHMYQRTTGIFRFSFPHPLLCGPKGVIRVMPDHPHEGECVTPESTDLKLDFNGGAEYPQSTGAGSRPVPEIISTSSVLSGTRSGSKDPTASQNFGGICAYDGHRAGVGRVVTDATWHHFVNVNLVGQISPPLDPSDPKSRNHPGGGGFLATVNGRAHLENIRTYYRNLSVWMARPKLIKCMNSRLAWTLVWTNRILEATTATVDLAVEEVEPHILKHVGLHARDVLGRLAGRCQSIRLILDLILEPIMPELIPEIDPWHPDPPRRLAASDQVGWFDGTPLLDMSLGAALIGLRGAFPQPNEKVVADLETDSLVEVIAKAGSFGIQRALTSAMENASAIGKFFALGKEDTSTSQ